MIHSNGLEICVYTYITIYIKIYIYISLYIYIHTYIKMIWKDCLSITNILFSPDRLQLSPNRFFFRRSRASVSEVRAPACWFGMGQMKHQSHGILNGNLLGFYRDFHGIWRILSCVFLRSVEGVYVKGLYFPNIMMWYTHVTRLVGGLEHFLFFHILGC